MKLKILISISLLFFFSIKIFSISFLPDKGQEIVIHAIDGSNVESNSSDLISNCLPDLIITIPLMGGEHVYLASNTITANNIIYVATNVFLGANNKIALSSGFHAKPGCEFRANNKGCASEVGLSSTLKSGMERNSEPDTEVKLLVYPNPTNGSVTISMGENELEKNIAIYSVSGELISKTISMDNEINIDLSSYAKGFYFVRINCDNKVYSEKLLLME